MDLILKSEISEAKLKLIHIALDIQSGECKRDPEGLEVKVEEVIRILDKAEPK
ncbi:hypothetical protein ACQCT5_10385 [Sutcliffiella halmapala]